MRLTTEFWKKRTYPARLAAEVEAGLAARAAGIEFIDNPHEIGTAMSRAWSKGWRQAGNATNESLIKRFVSCDKSNSVRNTVR